MRDGERLPDGLWLNFGGTPVDPYVDIFAIEACGSLQNLLDKRSRFAPSTHSLLAVCPVDWLMAPASCQAIRRPRWKATGVLLQATDGRVRAAGPRHARLYGLKRNHYPGFARHQLPHAHEYFVPMEALTAEDGDKDPALRALLARASATANSLLRRDGPARRRERQTRLGEDDRARGRAGR